MDVVKTWLGLVVVGIDCHPVHIVQKVADGEQCGTGFLMPQRSL